MGPARLLEAGPAKVGREQLGPVGEDPPAAMLANELAALGHVSILSLSVPSRRIDPILGRGGIVKAFGPLSVLHGLALLGLVAGMLFIEELGAPLPLPGDLVIALGGVAAATGAVSLPEMLIAAMLGVAAGSITAREMFGRLGRPLVYRLADRLHSRRALDRASAWMRRGKWEGVLAARMIPGLRVPVNAAAGVSGVTAKTFAIGVAASVPIYVGFLVGVGFMVGQPFVDFLLAAERAGVSAAIWLIAGAAFGAVLWLMHRLQLWPGVPSFLPPRD